MKYQSIGKMISRGRTAEIFLWGNDRVLKLFFKNISITEAEYEAWVTRAAYDAGLPVPQVDGIVEVDGRHGIVFERINGLILSAAMFAKPWKFPELARTMAELHARIHRCGLPGLQSRSIELKRIILERIALPGDTKSSLLGMLERLPDGSELCHGDFHPDNIILTPKGPIIIDWLTAKSGNSLADIARTSLLLRVGSPPGCNTLSRRMHTLGGSLVFSVYMKRYSQLRAFSNSEFDKWLAVVAAARLAEKIPEETSKLLAIITKSTK